VKGEEGVKEREERGGGGRESRGEEVGGRSGIGNGKGR